MTDDGKQDRWLWLLLRPRDWFPYLGLPLLGWSGSSGPSGPWLALVWSGLYLAGGYGFNGVCDRNTDAAAKNPLRGSAISSRVAGSVSLILLLSPIPLAFGLLPAVRWLSLGMVALGVVYSLPRWGLKRVAGIASLANVALFVPLYWIGANRMPTFNGNDLWVFCLLSLPSLQSQLMHELGDGGEDRRAGIRSTAMWLGEFGTRRSVQAIGALVVLVSGTAWQRGLLGSASGGLFVVAGMVSAVPWDEPSGIWSNWRGRIKLAYIVPCIAWLLEGLGLSE